MVFPHCLCQLPALGVITCSRNSMGLTELPQEIGRRHEQNKKSMRREIPILKSSSIIDSYTMSSIIRLLDNIIIIIIINRGI